MTGPSWTRRAMREAADGSRQQVSNHRTLADESGMYAYTSDQE